MEKLKLDSMCNDGLNRRIYFENSIGEGRIFDVRGVTDGLLYVYRVGAEGSG